MTALFDPAQMPERDLDGWAYHPDLESLLMDRPEGEDVPLDLEKLKAAGFEHAYVAHEDDVEEESAAFAEYWAEGKGVSLWSPSQPSGEGWQLVAVYDTENGPFAMFVRPTADRATRFVELHPETDALIEAFLSEVRTEVARAREKFPGNRVITVALAEEFGEVCKAVLDESPERVRLEAVQVAAMACRLVLDGDCTLAAWRAEHGLARLGTVQEDEEA